MRLRHIFLISSLLLIVIVTAYTYVCLRQNNGQLVYPLDDTYIHLSIAKNLALYNVWGITRFGFSSASSSILYTLILTSVFLLTGINIWIPLVINLLGAIVTLGLIVRWTGRYLSPAHTLLFCLLFMALVPLPAMVISGMEHTLQILLCLSFVWLSYRKLSGERVNPILYFFIAILAVAVRYEDLFLVGITSLVWILIKKKYRTGLVLLTAILLPIGLFGLYSLSNKGYFLPNTLLIKGSLFSHSFPAWIGIIGKKAFTTGLLYALLFIPFLYFFLHRLKNRSELKNNALYQLYIIIAGTGIAHFLFARFGWFFRYEAYLIAMEFMLIPMSWKLFREYLHKQHFTSRLIILTMAGVFLFPVWSRIRIGTLDYPNKAMKNIHDQQLEMANFIHTYFPNSTIAVNDIGAVSFFNENLHVFDMIGLGNQEVVQHRNKLDSNFFRRHTAAEDVKIGLFYPDLFKNKIPSSWKCVGTWYLSDNFICGDSKVGFYAIDRDVAEKLIRSLREYQDQLPPNVFQQGIYFTDQ